MIKFSGKLNFSQKALKSNQMEITNDDIEVMMIWIIKEMKFEIRCLQTTGKCLFPNFVSINAQ